jgi:hypothetical protein
MPKPVPDADCVKLAVEVTKCAFGQDSDMTHKPDQVAKFLEIIAYKLADLKFGQREG